MTGGLELRRYRVVGRVQGVGFRWWTQRVAGELQLVGRVRNASDGSVDVRAGGRREALERLEAALRRGPPSARVEVVETEELLAEGSDGAPAPWIDFQIER